MGTARRGNRHDGACHAPRCERMDWPRCGWLGLRRGWGGPVARTGAAVRNLCVGAGRIWTWCGVMPRGCGADGLCADAAAVLDARSGSASGLGGPRRISASSARRRCRPWAKRCRMSAVSVVPKARTRFGGVRGFGALAERGGDALGPGDEQPNDEEQEERRAAGLGPGGGGR